MGRWAQTLWRERTVRKVRAGLAIKRIREETRVKALKAGLAIWASKGVLRHERLHWCAAALAHNGRLNGDTPQVIALWRLKNLLLK